MRDGRLQILTPVFNDWAALRILIERVSDALADAGLSAEMLVVDDGSNAPRTELVAGPLRGLTAVRILTLARNLGHQRAIAIGLAYAEEKLDPLAVVVMDGDGEDDPADVARLIEKCRAEQYQKIVFAQRAKRSERIGFRMFYRLYRALFRLATGSGVRVGNFSILPRVMLQRVVSVPEIWNHYAAGVLKTRLPFTTIEADRATRYAGESQMNFSALVAHGLSAIAVSNDLLSTRLFIVMLFATLLAVASTSPVAIAVTLFITMMTGCFMFIALSARTEAELVPQRDYRHYVHRVAEY